MVVTDQYRVTSLAAGKRRRTRDLLILHLPFLKNEAFRRIPSQRVLTALQPEAGPDPSPCQLWVTGRLSSPELGLCSVRKRCDCRTSSVSLSFAATSSSIPKVAVELDDVSGCLPSLRGTYVTVHTDSHSFVESCPMDHCYMLQYHSFARLNKCNRKSIEQIVHSMNECNIFN